MVLLINLVIAEPSLSPSNSERKKKRLSQLDTGQPSVRDADEDHRFQVNLGHRETLVGGEGG